MARGNGKSPQVIKNKELIGAGEVPEVVRDVNGEVNFRKTVGKTSIKPDRFKPSPKQSELTMEMPKVSTKAVRSESPKQQTVEKAATKSVTPSTQEAKKEATTKNKPKVKPATPPKTSLKQFLKNSAKTISKNISKGMSNLRSYLKKNIAPKSQAKAKTIKRNSPTKGR